ncbi:MAG: PQQ-dependent dehydrogenase, methanol/ethanol family [Acidobacteriota bacterium]
METRKLGARRVHLSFFLLALTLSVQALAQEPSGARLIQARSEPQNWLTYFGTYNAWRYSPLSAINRQNVGDLVPVWAFHTGRDEAGLNATPLVMDGVMYLVGPFNRVFAIDAATGKRIWSYFYDLPEVTIPNTPGTRGIALGYGKVYLGTLDNHLVALDARTGKELWDIEIEDVRQCGCNITSAPLVVKDKVIVGVTGGENAHRGYLNAFDARTGRHIWRFYTIPGPGEPGFETWDKDSWRLGGAPTWLTGSYDAELNRIYWGVGNPSSDFYGEHRKGDNLYTNSIIALDADTGKLQWYFQEIAHDLYDFDSAYECVLLDVVRGGTTQKLLIHPNKGGYTWVLDRVTGKFVNAWPFADAINWMKGVDEAGKPKDLLSVPPAGTTFICPNAAGARSWNHSTYSPRTGWWYNTGAEWCGTITPQKEVITEGARIFGGTMGFLPPKDGPAFGHIDAFDPLTGEKRWTVKTKFVNLASLLSTGGDLIFTGDIEGNAFALDARTGEKKWSFNTGGGLSGSPITYQVKGRQYVAIPSGNGGLIRRFIPLVWPEARQMMPEPASTLMVFALPKRKGR